MDLDLTSPTALEAHGFELIDGQAPASYGPDGLTVSVTTDTYAEWFQSFPGDWFDGATLGAGWWAEVVLDVDGSGCAQAGMWLHDGTDLVEWSTGPSDEISLYPSGEATPAHGAGTHDVLLIGNADRSVDVWVDGTREIRHADSRRGGGSEVFGLSTHAACPTTVVWRSLSYGAPALDVDGADSDGDGVVDSADLCVDTADDQADADGDRRGDACDPCPLDPLDDSDGDGACADVDSCPDDPSVTTGTCPVDTYNGFPYDQGMTNIDQGMISDPIGGSSGCGCDSSGPGAGWAWSLAGLIGMRRRRVR